MKQRGLKLKNRSDMGKKRQLFICKKGENNKTPPYVVAALYVLSILTGKTWSIQSTKMWLLQPNNVP